jgi:integrase
MTPWSVTQRVAALERAWMDPDWWRQIENFDQQVADMLSAGGMPVRVTDPVVARMRQEAAVVALYALKHRERARLSNALRMASGRVLGGDLDQMITIAKPARARPEPSLSLTELFGKWVSTVNPGPKERGRLDHQIKRLIETVGDIPANWLGKEQIVEFMGLVARFPGRKRPAHLNALPMRELVETFEAENEERDDEERWGTLTKTTVEEWFASYRRMFDLAVTNDWSETNPWTPLRKYVVNGAESIERRAFTDEEIADLFGKPPFQGEGKGVEFWLPILALHHGCRMSELAALPLGNCKAKGDVHFFDLTANVKVKTKDSGRLVPLHPKMVELGWLDYVKRQTGPWLFPELDHDHKFGPGHEYSKAFGRWLRDNGFNDPATVFHSFRHTWKRAARESPVKEERHDVISGHKSPAVSRSYGEGADVSVLAQDMSLIQFPAFPNVTEGGAPR